VLGSLKEDEGANLLIIILFYAKIKPCQIDCRNNCGTLRKNADAATCNMSVPLEVSLDWAVKSKLSATLAQACVCVNLFKVIGGLA